MSPEPTHRIDSSHVPHPETLNITPKETDLTSLRDVETVTRFQPLQWGNLLVDVLALEGEREGQKLGEGLTIDVIERGDGRVEFHTIRLIKNTWHDDRVVVFTGINNDDDKPVIVISSAHRVEAPPPTPSSQCASLDEFVRDQFKTHRMQSPTSGRSAVEITREVVDNAAL